MNDVKIVSAAIVLRVPGAPAEYDVPVIISLPPPARHHNILHACSSIHGQTAIEGFLLSNGHFAHRDEALRIAIKSGQVVRGYTVTNRELYSEDLW